LQPLPSLPGGPVLPLTAAQARRLGVRLKWQVRPVAQQRRQVPVVQAPARESRELALRMLPLIAAQRVSLLRVGR
jgi:hypothetical protein